MKRRTFLATGVSGAIGAPLVGRGAEAAPAWSPNDVRGLFPRLEREIFLNAAGGAPLGRFAEDGLRRYMDFQRLGPGEGRLEYFKETRAEIRPLFASMIGARPDEIALVYCTKAGEQIVLDGLDPMRHGRNVVTNDLHFSGSLHNLVGLRRAGLDVRIVRSVDWRVRLEDMDAAIDERTALVAVTLVSNVNGHIEPIRELAEIAHARGALVYADIIQAAGIVPVDVRAMGIDFAACSGYKWLYGVHGAGFLYVAAEHQGTALPDRLFPGHAHPTYPPWSSQPDPEGDFRFEPPRDASRYEPGHVGYLGYCGLYEGLRFVREIGVERARDHSARLNRRLLGLVDPDRHGCLTPDLDRSPIVTFRVDDPAGLRERMAAARIIASLSGDRLRVSPGVYSTEADIDRLAEALNTRG